MNKTINLLIIILLVIALLVVLYLLFQGVDYSSLPTKNTFASGLLIPLTGDDTQPQEKNTVNQVQSASVNIQNSGFLPAAITIGPGTSVVWINSDSAPHQIDIIGFDNGKDITGPLINKNVRYSLGFFQKGVYSYFCKIHPAMRGKIIVQ
jgi:plastocyanin